MPNHTLFSVHSASGKAGPAAWLVGRKVARADVGVLFFSSGESPGKLYFTGGEALFGSGFILRFEARLEASAVWKLIARVPICAVAARVKGDFAIPQFNSGHN